MKIVKHKYLYIFAFIFFFMFTTYKFYNVIDSNEISVADHGDGIGSMFNIYTANQNYQKHGLKILFSDLLKYENLGIEKPIEVRQQPGPIGTFWKSLSVVSLKFVNIFNSYDLIAALNYFFTGLAGFLLIYYLTQNYSIALIFGLIFCNIDAYYSRLSGHQMGLGALFSPILLTLITFWVSEKSKFYYYAFYGVALAVVFNVNEYYGYYGLIFSASLLLSIQIYKKSINKKFILLTLLSIACFTLAMITLYPNLILAKILGLFTTTHSQVQIANYARNWSDFQNYTAGNILYLFKPINNTGLRFIDEVVFRPNKTGEFTFRIGFLIPTCIILLSLLNKETKKNVLNFARTISIPSALIILFCSTTKFPLSLVKLTYVVAPIFRVSVRSLIYIDIVLISLCAIAFSTFIKNFDKEKKMKFWLYFTVMLLAVIYDSSGFKFLFTQKGMQLPQTEVYESLTNYPNNYSAIEIPYSQHVSRVFPAIVHNKNLINAEIDYKDQFAFIRSDFKDINAETIKKLKEINVKYIISTHVLFPQLSSLDKELKLISQENSRIGKLIYEIQ